MANEAKIKVVVSAGDAAKQMDELTNSTKSLKAQIKEATKEAMSFGDSTSKEAIEAQKKVARLKEEFSDFKDRVAAFNPEAKFQSVAKLASGIAGGFSAATGAMALFGAESEDVQKALLKVQAALAISQGLNDIKGLGDAMANFKLVAIDAFKSLGKAIMANPLFTLVAVIGGVIAAFQIFQAMNDTYSAQINEQIKLNNQKFAEEEEGLNKTLALARAKGEETIGIEQDLLEATRNRISEELRLERLKYEKRLEYADEGLKAVGVFFGKSREKELREENDQVKKINDLDKQLKQAEINIEVKGEEEKKKLKDKALKDYQDYLNKKKAADAEAARHKAALDKEELDRQKEIQAQDDEWLRKQQETDAKQRIKEQEQFDFEAAQMAARVEMIEEEFRIKREKAEQEKAMREAVQQFTIQTAQQNLDTVATFMDAAMNNQLNAAKGNEARQEQIRKTFFERDKKVQIAQTLISTYQGATAAFASGSKLSPVAGFIAAGAAVVQGLANVAKIRSMQYQGGGSSGGGQPSAPNFGGASGTPSPAPQQPNQNTTNLDREKIEAGQRITIQNTISETEITRVQKRVNMVQERATIK